ncbi:MAG: hypothetical protein KBS70_05185 [Bacteroidales bacterium]|nr:hypothetical protein [Candidatus Colicola equi]
MAKLEYAYPITAVHGVLDRKSKFGAAKRIARNQEGESKPFSVRYGQRISQPSADELAARARFKAVAAAIKVRKLDPNKTRTDAAAFKEQSTYKTMYAYLWHVCGDEYDEALAEANAEG